MCAVEGLDPWQDPTNEDTTLTRSRVRHEVLPWLETHLGPGVSGALARTASVLGADADYLDARAAERFAEIRAVTQGPASGTLQLDLGLVHQTPAALRRRVLAQACTEVGGETPSFERLCALDGFALGYGAAGPLQMAGKVAVWRRRADAAHVKGRLEFHRTG